MRVLLRNRKTRLYYVGRNQSGNKHEQALDFGDIPGAATFAAREKLPDMEIVLRYETCDGEVPIPIMPALVRSGITGLWQFPRLGSEKSA